MAAITINGRYGLVSDLRGGSPANKAAVIQAALTNGGEVGIFNDVSSSPEIVVLNGGLTVGTGATLKIGSGVDLRPTQRILLTGTAPSLIGEPCSVLSIHRARRFTVVAGTVSNNVFCATLDDANHPFVSGDIVAFRNTVGLATSIEGTSKTITRVDGEKIYCAHTSNDSDLTVPYERTDGWNRGDYAIYPTVQLTRSQSAADAAVAVTSATDWQLQGLEINGARQAGVWIENSPGGSLKAIVHDTAADGIDIVGASHNLKFDAEVYRTGDDAIALLGWRNKNDVPRNVQAGTLHVHDLLYNGRGVALIGSEGFKCQSLVAENIYHAGLLVYTDSTTRTFGNRGAWFGSVTLHTCGQAAAEVAGWNSNAYGALHVTGGNSDTERQDGLTIDDLNAINSRGYAVADGNIAGSVRGVRIKNSLFEGGRNTPSNVLAPDSWLMDVVRCQYTAQMGLLFGGANARGRSKIGKLELRHFNFTQTRRWITGISCVGGTVTINCPGHGITGTVTLWVSRVWSDASNANVDTERTMQLADEALGTYYSYTGNDSAWAANTAYTKRTSAIAPTGTNLRFICTVTGISDATTEPTWDGTMDGRKITDGTTEWMCIGRAFTNNDAYTADTDTITLEGTGLDDSNSPRVYTYGGRPSPQTYCNVFDNSGFDGLQIGAFPSGSNLLVDEVVIAEQIGTIDATVNDGGGNNSTVTTAIDLSGRAAS